MKLYRHIFFDLDRTLWDYEINASEALMEIYAKYSLQQIFENFENFRNAFGKHNNMLWDMYRDGQIAKDIMRIQRFELSFQDYGISALDLASKLNKDFLRISPRKTNLIPGTADIIGYLKNKGYLLYIITNGFTHIQKIKLEVSGLLGIFQQMFTSDSVGSHKPNRAIFEHAVKSVNARKAESLMIGDELEVDIIGARNFGMDQVYYNPSRLPHNEKVTYEIHHLGEIKKIL
jgi:putative hydrolase of the HAD superfamily